MNSSKICQFCDNSRWIADFGQFKLLGCFHEPYQGKWCAEIKECPKK